MSLTLLVILGVLLRLRVQSDKVSFSCHAELVEASRLSDFDGHQ